MSDQPRRPSFDNPHAPPQRRRSVTKSDIAAGQTNVEILPPIDFSGQVTAHSPQPPPPVAASGPSPATSPNPHTTHGRRMSMTKSDPEITAALNRPPPSPTNGMGASPHPHPTAPSKSPRPPGAPTTHRHPGRSPSPRKQLAVGQVNVSRVQALARSGAEVSKSDPLKGVNFNENGELIDDDDDDDTPQFARATLGGRLSNDDIDVNSAHHRRMSTGGAIGNLTSRRADGRDHRVRSKLRVSGLGRTSKGTARGLTGASKRGPHGRQPSQAFAPAPTTVNDLNEQLQKLETTMLDLQALQQSRKGMGQPSALGLSMSVLGSSGRKGRGASGLGELLGRANHNNIAHRPPVAKAPPPPRWSRAGPNKTGKIGVPTSSVVKPRKARDRPHLPQPQQAQSSTMGGSPERAIGHTRSQTDITRGVTDVGPGIPKELNRDSSQHRYKGSSGPKRTRSMGNTLRRWSDSLSGSASHETGATADISLEAHGTAIGASPQRRRAGSGNQKYSALENPQARHVVGDSATSTPRTPPTPTKLNRLLGLDTPNSQQRDTPDHLTDADLNSSRTELGTDTCKGEGKGTPDATSTDKGKTQDNSIPRDPPPPRQPPQQPGKSSMLEVVSDPINSGLNKSAPVSPARTPGTSASSSPEPGIFVPSQRMIDSLSRISAGPNGEAPELASFRIDDRDASDGSALEERGSLSDNNGSHDHGRDGLNDQLAHSLHIGSRISIITNESDDVDDRFNLKLDNGRLKRETSDLLTYSQSLNEMQDPESTSSSLPPNSPQLTRLNEPTSSFHSTGVVTAPNTPAGAQTEAVAARNKHRSSAPSTDSTPMTYSIKSTDTATPTLLDDRSETTATPISALSSRTQGPPSVTGSHTATPAPDSPLSTAPNPPSLSPELQRLVKDVVPENVQSHVSALQQRVFSLAAHAQLQHRVNEVLESAISTSASPEETSKHMLEALATYTRKPDLCVLRSFDESLTEIDVEWKLRAQSRVKLPMTMDLLSDICNQHNTHSNTTSTTTLIAQALSVNGENFGTACLFYRRKLPDHERATVADLLASWTSELSKFLGLLLTLRRKHYLRQEISDTCKSGTFSESINSAFDVAARGCPLDTVCLLLFLPSAVEGVSVQYKVVKSNHIVFDSFKDRETGILTESFSSRYSFVNLHQAAMMEAARALHKVPGPNTRNGRLIAEESATSLGSSSDASNVDSPRKLQFLQAAYGDTNLELGQSWRGSMGKKKASSFERFLEENIDTLAMEDVTGLRSHLGLGDNCIDIVIRGGGDTGSVPLARLLAQSDRGDPEILEMLAEAILQRALHYHAEWKRLALYFNTEITKRLLNHTNYYARFLTPDTRECAILFVDVTSFTRLSEQILVKPALILQFIQHWSQYCIAAVKKAGGVFDKMIGDCIIAYWGPPFFEASPEQRCRLAIETAVEIVRYTAYDLAGECALEPLQQPDITLGVSVGLNYGDLCVGFCGEHAGYTGFSSAMNETARLQGLAQNNEILCMTSMQGILGEDTPYPFGETRSTMVKNVSEPLRYHALQVPMFDNDGAAK